MNEQITIYRGHRFPEAVISHTVWLYYRFSLSFREVEELLAARGVECEFLFKRLLAADTNHGNRISIGSCPGKRCSELCPPASDRVAGLRSLGEHVPDCNSP